MENSLGFAFLGKGLRDRTERRTRLENDKEHILVTCASGVCESRSDVTAVPFVRGSLSRVARGGLFLTQAAVTQRLWEKAILAS